MYLICELSNFNLVSGLVVHVRRFCSVAVDRYAIRRFGLPSSKHDHAPTGSTSLLYDFVSLPWRRYLVYVCVGEAFSEDCACALFIDVSPVFVGYAPKRFKNDLKSVSAVLRSAAASDWWDGGRM